MPCAGRDGNTIRLLTQLLSECDCIFERARDCELARMRHDSEKTAKHEITESIGGVRADRLLKPVSISAVIDRGLAMGIDQHIHIRENQDCSSIVSSNDAESSRSIPGRRPVPAHVRSRTGVSRRGLSTRR